MVGVGKGAFVFGIVKNMRMGFDYIRIEWIRVLWEIPVGGRAVYIEIW